jgi:hypothetical protein
MIERYEVVFRIDVDPTADDTVSLNSSRAIRDTLQMAFRGWADIVSIRKVQP